MVRGISGGQKKRVTTGEMIVGVRRCLTGQPRFDVTCLRKL